MVRERRFASSSGGLIEKRKERREKKVKKEEEDEKKRRNKMKPKYNNTGTQNTEGVVFPPGSARFSTQLFVGDRHG